jgi:DNA-directed RNA polymerase specialized sigma24 family protein
VSAIDVALVGPVLARDPKAMRQFVRQAKVVVEARVARTLLRVGRRQGQRDPRQEIADIAQEVFLHLFENGGAVLRAWDPARGLSLANFVGLVAERDAIAILRSGRRSPWTEDPTDFADATAGEVFADGAPSMHRVVQSRDMLMAILDRLRLELSPRGYELFVRLYVDEASVEDVCAAFAMQPDAVYAWRSRLGKRVRALGEELFPPDSASDSRA